MNRVLITIFILLNVCVKSYSQDYTDYYNSVNRAEEQIFVKGQFDEGIKTYINTFQRYDFVFVYDCVTAMQIALYAKNEKAFLVFIDKATQNGLTPRVLDLKIMNYVHDNPIYIRNKDKILKTYDVNRKHYLRRIDTATLSQMIVLYAYNQLSKNRQASTRGRPIDETTEHRNERCGPLAKQTIDSLSKIIEKKGLPFDKLIGIDQADIMCELNTGKFDAINYYYKYEFDTRYYAVREQFEFDDYLFSSTMYLTLLDNYNAYMGTVNSKRGFLRYSDEFYMKQIKLGNVHPKEVAYLYDFPLAGHRYVSIDTLKGEKYFHCYLSFVKDMPEDITIKQVDRFRAMFFIPPLENDRMKFDFMRAHGMCVGAGRDGCRS